MSRKWEILQGDLNSYYRFLNELGERFHASHHLVSDKLHSSRISYLWLPSPLPLPLGVKKTKMRSPFVIFSGDEDGTVSCDLARKMPWVTSYVRWIVRIQGWWFYMIDIMVDMVMTIWSWWYSHELFFSSFIFQFLFSERIETQSLLCEKLIAYVSR